MYADIGSIPAEAVDEVSRHRVQESKAGFDDTDSRHEGLHATHTQAFHLIELSGLFRAGFRMGEQKPG